MDERFWTEMIYIIILRHLKGLMILWRCYGRSHRINGFKSSMPKPFILFQLILDLRLDGLILIVLILAQIWTTHLFYRSLGRYFRWRSLYLFLGCVYGRLRYLTNTTILAL